MIAQHRSETNTLHAEIAELEKKLESAQFALLKARDEINSVREESKMVVGEAEKRSHVLSEELELHREIGRERERKLSQMLAEVAAPTFQEQAESFLQGRKSAEEEISALRMEKFSLETCMHHLKEKVGTCPCVEEERKRRIAAEEHLKQADRHQKDDKQEVKVCSCRGMEEVEAAMQKLMSRCLLKLASQLDDIDQQIFQCGSELEQVAWPVNLFLLYLNVKDLNDISQRLLSVFHEVG
eukprot:123113-Hanusia_phi.AAC.3